MATSPTSFALASTPRRDFDTAGDVRKTPKTGGATIDVPQPYYPIDHGGAVRTAFAVDETSVYYTTGHSVRRAPK